MVVEQLTVKLPLEQLVVIVAPCHVAQELDTAWHALYALFCEP